MALPMPGVLVVCLPLLVAGLSGCLQELGYDLGHHDVCDADYTMKPHSQDPAERAVVTGERIVHVDTSTATFEWSVTGDFLCSYVDVPERGEGSSLPQPHFSEGTFRATVTGLRPGWTSIWRIQAPGLDGVGAGSLEHPITTAATLPTGSPLQVAYTDGTTVNVVSVAWYVLGGDGTERSWLEWSMDGGASHTTEAQPGQGRFTSYLPPIGDDSHRATLDSHGYDGAAPGNYTFHVVAEDTRGRVLGAEQTIPIMACVLHEGPPSWTPCPGRDAREP